MITISAWGAALSHHPEQSGLAAAHVCGPQQGDRITSPCAAYAKAACEQLPHIPKEAALVTLVGPTGAVVSAFDNAWKRASGPLTQSDFAAGRFRRIHPFTLVRSLQNQVPSVLSMTYGLQGPSLNLLESPTQLAYALPNIAADLAQCGTLLLVLAAAGGRDEEVTKLHARNQTTATDPQPGVPVLLEGAICFLLTTKSPGLGTLSTTMDPHQETVPQLPQTSPVLDAGLKLLHHIAAARPGQITLSDLGGHSARLNWSPTCPL